MDKYVELAKQAISAAVKTKISMPKPEDFPSLQKSKSGVFVSLHKKSDHSLRGCIGTFLPTKDSIAEEIINNAIAAATEDPRFDPVSTDELDNLRINVDVLSAPEAIKDLDKLDPIKYGLIVQNQLGQKGLLLPDIGIDSVQEQFQICCEKGGIDPATDKLLLFRFTVERHK